MKHLLSVLLGIALAIPTLAQTTAQTSVIIYANEEGCQKEDSLCWTAGCIGSDAVCEFSSSLENILRKKGVKTNSVNEDWFKLLLQSITIKKLVVGNSLQLSWLRNNTVIYQRVLTQNGTDFTSTQTSNRASLKKALKKVNKTKSNKAMDQLISKLLDSQIITVK